MLFKIVLGAIFENKIFAQAKIKELDFSITLRSMSHHNSTEIVQDPSVCRLIDLKLSLYKYWESPHPTLMIDGKDTITAPITNFTNFLECLF